MSFHYNKSALELLRALGCYKLLLERIPKMLVVRFEVEKFDGLKNFRLWCIKMKAVLVQHGLKGVLEGEVMLALSCWMWKGCLLW